MDLGKWSKKIKVLDLDGYSEWEIAMARKTGKVEVIIVEKYFHFMHAKIKYVGGKDLYFTDIYASPREEEIKELWDELMRFASNVNGERL